MLDTMTRFLAGVSDGLTRRALRPILNALVQRFGSAALNSAGLVIKAGGSTLAKIGASDFYAVANGVLVKIAAATDMPALTGINITANSFNVVCFFVDAAGTVTAVAGTEGTAIGSVKFPTPPDGKALIGFLLITHSSTFTGGTTALDTATTVYFNASATGSPDPSMLVG